MRISDFIASHILVKTKKDIFYLMLKIVVLAILVNEICDVVRSYEYLAHSNRRDRETELIFLFIKHAVFISIIYLFFRYLKRMKEKGFKKRILTIFLFGSLFTHFLNGSILGIYYIEGPYWGKVVDADTGEPIVGANVMGIWKIAFLASVATTNTFADARETVTNSQGHFVLPPGRYVWLWPLSCIYLDELYVFKPGYDSHPPCMQVAWRDADKEKWERKLAKVMNHYEDRYAIEGIYRGQFTVITKNIKVYEPTIVRLNKAISENEREKAMNAVSFGDVDWDRFKVKRFEEAVERSKKNMIEKSDINNTGSFP